MEAVIAVGLISLSIYGLCWGNEYKSEFPDDPPPRRRRKPAKRRAKAKVKVRAKKRRKAA